MYPAERVIMQWFRILPYVYYGTYCTSENLSPLPCRIHIESVSQCTPFDFGPINFEPEIAHRHFNYRSTNFSESDNSAICELPRSGQSLGPISTGYFLSDNKFRIIGH